MNKKLILIISSIIFAIGLSISIWWYFQKENLASGFQVVFFDVGQGDAAFVRFGSGKKLLIDCGKDKSILNKLGQYVSFWDRTIDILLISHFDLDHYGGCVDVLKRYDVKTIVINEQEKQEDKYWGVWKRQLEQEQAKIKIIRELERWQFEDAALEFLSPFPSLNLASSTSKSNNFSIVFRLITSSSPHSFLFTGDIEEVVEKILIEKYCINSSVGNCPLLKADIIKIPHHGSDTSSSKEFLEAVDPRFAVISVGKYNTFGHPSLRVIKKIERIKNTTILRTDKKGDIILK